MAGLVRRVWGSVRSLLGRPASQPSRRDPDAFVAEPTHRRHDPDAPDGFVQGHGTPTAQYPGDYTGPLHLSYAPHPDDVPDPGEVVWTWVPFEEDYTRGKDRPVLIIAQENAQWLLGLMLSSKDHDRDRAQEESERRYWVEIGPGPWDKSGRPSSARVNRVVRVRAARVRRIGGRLDRQRFEAVAAGVYAHRGQQEA